ncbi:MAG: coenzyme F430 synthase [Methanomassiliicoccales archaeon]
MSLRVLLLDLTHGAEVLAREYLSQGQEVTAVDVYHTAPLAMKRQLREEGIRVLSAAPREHFDLLVAPVHCPDRYIGGASFDTRLTHHEAVGRLARFSVPVVEVTGLGAKTSTVHLLAHQLAYAGKKVLALSSRGAFLVDKTGTKVLEPRSSIAPASVLRMSKVRMGQDIAVLEVSLGGTGSADVGIITSLSHDYHIAQGTRRASDGKKQMLTLMKEGGTALFPAAEKDIWLPHLPQGRRAITFGRGGDVQLLLPEDMRLGQPVHAAFRCPECLYGFSMPGDFLGAAYSTALEASFAALMAMNENLDLAMESLEHFHGIPGRGELQARQGGWTIKERNPGVSASSLEYLVSVLERDYGIRDLGVVVDPVSVKVCEKLDLKAIRDALGQHPSVEGLYLSENAPEQHEGFELIASQKDAEYKHEVLLWCMKEGFT